MIVLAEDEARILKHAYIGTEHILLGLLREEHSVAASVLGSLDVSVEKMRAQVTQIVGADVEMPTDQLPFTPRAKKVLELARREAAALGHSCVDKRYGYVMSSEPSRSSSGARCSS